MFQEVSKQAQKVMKGKWIQQTSPRQFPGIMKCHVAVRPDEIVVGQGPVAGRVVACEFLGGSWRCRVTVGADEVAVLHDQPLTPGQDVQLSTPAGSRQVLRVES